MIHLQKAKRKPQKIRKDLNNRFLSQRNTYGSQNFLSLSRPSSVDDVLFLQKTVGNNAVASLIQTKLKVNQPGDKYEQEAEQISNQVMRMEEPVVFQNTPLLQKQGPGNEQKIQATENPSNARSINPDVESKIDSLQQGGKPLDSNTRRFYEKRIGHDFGKVRIHDDIQAAQVNKDLNARAFTFRDHIVFGAGEFTQNSESGNRLLAHELTHVIQQKRHINKRTNASLMRQEGGFIIQRQSQCPSGSCHVHVKHYQSVFGSKEEEDLKWPYPLPSIQEKLWITPPEREALIAWLQSGGQEQQSSKRLSGQYIKSDVAQEYKKYREEFESRPNRKIKMIMFEVPKDETDPDWPKLKASEVSAKHKKKTFEDLGLLPEIKVFSRTVGRKEFVDYIEAQNRDEEVFGIIVQLPAPAHLQGDVKRISPTKDIDALSLEKDRKFNVPATSEGVIRVVLPFVQFGQTVAVIGGKGFVGRGVVSLLQERGIPFGVFDEEDDLKQVKAYDIVISAVGKPRVVKSEHLKPEHILVVDTGFTPETEKGGELKVIGDVEESAQEIPQHITTVPGGTGPVEMAVLMERAARLLGIEVRSWKVELREGKLRAVFSE
jgi:methylenetetrahydrofolate dehydrogenase (NADP+) / methenyltetrahydrofolate cyclohydrolase